MWKQIVGISSRFAGLLPAVVLAGCFSEAGTTGPEDDDDDAAVIIDMTPQLTFTPVNVTIRAGQTIRWRNTANFVHTATADPARAASTNSVKLPTGAATFHSGDIQPGGSYALILNTPGQYTYFCDPHEGNGMIATITVTP